MLSDITISFADQSVAFPALYILIGLLIILGLSGFVVALASTRRLERKSSEVTDILVVQLERIGVALDRLVSQNAPRAASEPARRTERVLQEWVVPGRTVPAPRVVVEGSALERAAQRLSQEQSKAQPEQVVQQNSTQEEPVAGNLSEPARSILYSMLGR
jgi:hypothetical protein